MFDSFHSVLIFDRIHGINIKMVSNVSHHTFENNVKQSNMNLHVFLFYLHPVQQRKMTVNL